MEDRNGLSEKNLEWIWKISTALIIPLIIWVFKISLSVQLGMEQIRSEVKLNKQSIGVVSESIKEINGDIKKILSSQ